MKYDEILESFTENHESWKKEIAYSLANSVSSADERITAAIKWRQVTFAVDGDYHHWICSINITKKAVVLIFHFGVLLEDERKALIAGESKFMRKLEFGEQGAPDDGLIREYVRRAVGKLPYFREHRKEMQKG